MWKLAGLVLLLAVACGPAAVQSAQSGPAPVGEVVQA